MEQIKEMILKRMKTSTQVWVWKNSKNGISKIIKTKMFYHHFKFIFIVSFILYQFSLILIRFFIMNENFYSCFYTYFYPFSKVHPLLYLLSKISKCNYRSHQMMKKFQGICKKLRGIDWKCIQEIIKKSENKYIF